MLDSLNGGVCCVCKISQVGCKSIIGLVNLINYQNFYSKIIPHEQVNKDKVSHYEQQFISCNTLNSPILLFYKKFSELDNYLSNIIFALTSSAIYYVNGLTYEIFYINKTEIIKKLRNYLEQISKFYVADGHHRINALLNIQAQSIVKFPQLYLSFIVQEGDLNLGTFNRFIKGVNVDTETLIQQLKQNYLIDQICPESLKFETNVHMYINNLWYQLNLRKDYHDYFTQLPPVHVSKFIISKLIEYFPSTSKVLYCPATGSIDDVMQFYQQNQCQIAVTVPNLSRVDLFNAIEKYYIFPPHSTYFTPKIPNDIFVQKINFPTSYTTNI